MNNKTQNIDWKEVEELRKGGATYREISEMLGIPQGTLSAQKSRRKIKFDIDHVKERSVEKMRGGEKPVTFIKEEKPVVKEKTINDFSPREMIKRLYELGYRIKDNGLYVVTLTQVNIKSVLSE